ncbi:MAG: glycosyltransferase family 4 protein [Dysgonamonadaceae bacterium]|nr:glycosyltransferase family 4 protein [Dysgonamonadaceae bacterium]MDD4727853.1 glycosyltransferase family 4 protein [Dysgonamonadaceae bacterium]
MIKDKKILFLLHLPPPVHGSSIVGKAIKESHIINRSFKTRYVNLLVSRSVDETGKTKFTKLLRFISSWIKLLIELINKRPNLCYFALTSTGNAFYKDVSLVFLLRLFKIKIVFHLHNKGIKRNSSKKINHLLYRYVFRKSYVILLSKYLYYDIDEFVSEEQLFICPNGVEDISLQTSRKFKQASPPINIIFLSNLIKSKGVFVLIEACEILYKKDYNIKCDFIGGEGDVSSNEFQRVVEDNGVVGIVKYLGKKYDKEKDEAYKNADIFVLPTQNDCFPLVLLEAMQYGLPVVSTYEGGIPDIVENNVTGFLVPQKDAQALAEKLELLIKDSELRIKMGAAGRVKYQNEFTLQAFETKLQEILETILLKETRKHL